MGIFSPFVAIPRAVDAFSPRDPRPKLRGSLPAPARRMSLPHLVDGKVDPGPVEDTAIVPLNRFGFLLLAVARRPLLRRGVMTGAANGIHNEPRFFSPAQRNISLFAKGLL